MYPQVANFLKCICAKNYENWLAVDKVIAKTSRLTFLAHPVCILQRICYWLCSTAAKLFLAHETKLFIANE